MKSEDSKGIDSDGSSGQVRISRRDALRAAGMGAVGAALVAPNLKALLAGTAGVAEAATADASSCVQLTPEQEVGPFFVAFDTIRSNIRSGQSGTSLALKIKLIDVNTCKPIKSAILSIWQANALGDPAVDSWTIQYYVTDSSRAPVLEWIEGMSPRAQADALGYIDLEEALVNHEDVKRRLHQNPEVREAHDNLPLPLKVARAVVQWRRENGYTQTQLTELLGTSQNQVYRIESGAANTTVTTLQKLQERLGLDFHIDQPAPFNESVHSH